MSFDRKILKELYPDIEIVILEPSYLDEAIIGISHDDRLIYDYEKLIKAFMKGDKITEEEAIEWIDYNTLRSLPYMGSNAPIIMNHILEYME